MKALAPAFEQATGASVSARFGAVGAIKELLDAGEPCDVLVLTDAMIATLAGADVPRGIDGATRAALGRVRTGVAVRSGSAHPAVDTPQALGAALQAADTIYFPDPLRATAGIHFASVMQRLGLHDTLAPRFSTHPNGATAMRELAASRTAQPIGCTQVTEILYTPGVDLVAMLPAAFELGTVYTAAVSRDTAQAALAARFVEAIAGADARALREQSGFEA